MLDIYSWFVLVFLFIAVVTTIIFTMTQARKLHKIALLSQTTSRTSTIILILTGKRPVKRKPTVHAVQFTFGVDNEDPSKRLDQFNLNNNSEYSDVYKNNETGL